MGKRDSEVRSRSMIALDASAVVWLVGSLLAVGALILGVGR